MIVPAAAVVVNTLALFNNNTEDKMKGPNLWIANATCATGITLSIAAIWTVYMKGCPKLFAPKHFEALPLAGRLIKKLPSLRYGAMAAADISNIAVFELSSFVFGFSFIIQVPPKENKKGEKISPLAQLSQLAAVATALASFLSLVYFRPIGARHLSKLPLINRVLPRLSTDLQGLASRVGHLCLGGLTALAAFVSVTHLDGDQKMIDDSKKKKIDKKDGKNIVDNDGV